MSAPGAGPPLPVRLGKEGPDRLVIEWGDGHRSVYTWKHLRDHCPCAGCREEQGRPPDPLHVLTPAELARTEPLAPVAMPAVGRYAYKIVWNDGHDTGLYTLEHLRALCQCPECAGKPADV
ncbi:MAG TPA: DUF971 domain-containing protein [Gemmataceae bacterium]|nr:DUF971 domain-containing protein [Gemmataceae bacterium]